MEMTLVAVVLVALFFDFTNGFHDTANAIATIVSTKALSARKAVIGAAVLNLIGAFLSLSVAATIAHGIVTPEAITLHTVLAGLVGAIVWNLITWRIGLPSSSSHALVGGLIGAGIAASGVGAVEWWSMIDKIAIPSLLSPFVGLVGAGLILYLCTKLLRKHWWQSKEKLHRSYRRLQLFSGGFVALMHGTNDAQKTMGIIALALLAANPGSEFHVPIWVIVSSAVAMALGTYMGGWKIVHTMGERITKLDPDQGFAAQTSTAATLAATSYFGLPVSTTHTISGSIVGAGAARSRSSVNWKVIKHILVAWVVTIPSAAVIGALAESVTFLPNGSGVLFTLLVVIVTIFYLTRNWSKEAYAQVRILNALLRRIKRKN